MGRCIKPEMIKTQVSGMKQALQKDNQDLLCVLSNIELLSDSDDLQGMAWSSVKAHMSNHKSVVQGITCANEEMIAGGEALEREVGDEDLIEEDINEIIQQQEKLIDTRNQQIEAYQNVISDHSNAPYIGVERYIAYAREQITHNETLIASAEEIIREQNQKIDKIDDIERNTGSLYQAASGLYANVNAGLLTLETSWSGSEFVANNLDWKSALDSRWEQREEINNKNAEVFLLSKGVTRKQIKNMEALGYTPAQVKAGWELLETEGDRKFFKYLMDGTSESYIKAFQTDPNDLSVNMSIVMAGYASRLMKLDNTGAATKKSIKQLTEFNNALLSSEAIYYNQFGDGMEAQSHLLYRDVYLERLYSGADLLVQYELASLAAMDPTEEGYKKKKQEYNKNLGLVNLWAVEALTIDKLGYADKNEARQVNISNLRYTVDEFMEFDLNQYSPSMMRMVTEEVKAHLVLQSNDLDNQWSRQELQRLREAKEQLLKTFIVKTAKGATFLLLGIYAPELVVLASIGDMAVSGAVGSIGGLDSHINSTGGKNAAKGINLVVPAVINYYIAVRDMENSITEGNYKNKMEWFGMGGKYKLVGEMIEGGSKGVTGLSITGIYNPEMIRQIEMWESEGIAGWIGWPKAEVKRVSEKIELLDISPSEKVDCQKLLTGNYEIVKEEDMGYFLDRIDDIQNAYLGGGKATNIQNEWRALFVPEENVYES